jgi:uncharacterized protein YbjT (DUF2867 family)
MSGKKVIAVGGATGAQGGGLVRAICADARGGYQARAITRNTASEKARALAQLGAEVVAADLDDVASLKRAFQGAHGLFCVTNFWEHFSPEKELQQAKNLADAAKAAGVKHVIWSTLEDTRKLVPLSDARMPTLMQKYKVPHFDAKGEADAYFLASGVPTTLLRTSFYWENLIGFGMGPRRGEDGKLVFALPMGKARLPGIGVEDIGRCAYAIFREGAKHAGKTIGLAGECLTGQQMADALTKALGEPVAYQAVPFDVYRKLGFPGADDLGNMFQYKHDFEREFCAARDPGVARGLHAGTQTFAAWLSTHEVPVGA